MRYGYCVYFNETKEQFSFTKMERAKKFNLLVFTKYLTKESAYEEAGLLNRDLDHWRSKLEMK